MRELISCWRNTRMIVLIALCAALYVAVLLPFKIATIVPGITELRPGAALPVLFSLLFGPAAAWGSAFGNVIGDLLGGTIGPGSLFGFAGNFLYGYAPYRVMKRFAEPGKESSDSFRLAGFLLGAFIASALCAIVIALGVDALKIVPFSFLVHTIFFNNVISSILLVPLLALALFNRVSQMKLTYSKILAPDEISRPLVKGGIVILIVFVLAVYVIGMMPSKLATFSTGGLPPLVEVALALLLILLALLML